MAYKVEISAIAKANFDAMRLYLLESFGDKVVKKFYLETDQLIDRLKEHPQQFKKVEGKRNARAGYLNNRVTCYFTILEDQNLVYIYDFFDNRQNPNRLEDILKG